MTGFPQLTQHGVPAHPVTHPSRVMQTAPFPVGPQRSSNQASPHPQAACSAGGSSRSRRFSFKSMTSIAPASATGSAAPKGNR